MELRNVVLVDGVRSAFGRGGRGKLVATRLDDAGAIVLRALLDRHPQIKDPMIEDFGLGNVSGGGEFTYLGDVPRLAGLPLEVLSIATRNGARALGVLEEVGTIEEGKTADLVVLAADPLADIADTRSIVHVIHGGIRYDPDELRTR